MADKDFDYGLPSTPGMFGKEPDENGHVYEDELVWWGYLHTEGTVHLKRYFDWVSYQEAGDSPFVRWQSRLFEAPSRDEALVRLKKMILAHTR